MQMNVLRTKQVSHVGSRDDHGQPIAGNGLAELLCSFIPWGSTVDTFLGLAPPQTFSARTAPVENLTRVYSGFSSELR